MADEEPDSTLQEQVGKRLRDLGLRRGLTFQDVERRSGGILSEAVMGSYERGKRGIPMNRLLLIGDFYDVPVDVLLRGSYSRGPRSLAAPVAHPVIRLDRLQDAPAEAGPLRQFVQGIRAIRGDYGGDVLLSLRAGDVITLAVVYGVSVDELTQRLTRWQVLIAQAT